jgi:hypothetical protein
MGPARTFCIDTASQEAVCDILHTAPSNKTLGTETSRSQEQGDSGSSGHADEACCCCAAAGPLLGGLSCRGSHCANGATGGCTV